MWRRIACHVAWMFALDAVLTCLGQDRPVCLLSNSAPGVRFELELGRVVVRHSGNLQARLEKASAPGIARQEKLKIHATEGTQQVFYECRTEDEHLLFEIAASRRMLIVRTRHTEEGNYRLVWQQPPQGDCVVECTRPGAAERIVAPSLWHIALQNPELAQRELAPILQLLFPTLELGQFRQELEAHLYAMASPGESISPDELHRLVVDLDNPQFARRQQAYLVLREQGIRALHHLQSLPQLTLSPEQRRRLARLEQAGTAGEADNPTRVALWLASDESVWLALENSADRERRSLATQRLAEIRGSTQRR